MGELPATRVYRGIRDEKPAPSGGVARADLCLADAAVDELLTRIAELDAEHRYPHMCRDGHPEIGHATDAERCPVCLERDAREMAEAALAERERMLELAHKTAGGPERSMSYELWLADLHAEA